MVQGPFLAPSVKRYCISPRKTPESFCPPKKTILGWVWLTVWLKHLHMFIVLIQRDLLLRKHSYDWIIHHVGNIQWVTTCWGVAPWKYRDPQTGWWSLAMLVCYTCKFYVHKNSICSGDLLEALIQIPLNCLDVPFDADGTAYFHLEPQSAVGDLDEHKQELDQGHIQCRSRICPQM